MGVFVGPESPCGLIVEQSCKLRDGSVLKKVGKIRYDRALATEES
jgi:hypothetical protein